MDRFWAKHIKKVIIAYKGQSKQVFRVGDTMVCDVEPALGGSLIIESITVMRSTGDTVVIELKLEGGIYYQKVLNTVNYLNIEMWGENVT